MKYNPSKQSLTMEMAECKVTISFFRDTQGDQHLALCVHCIDPATHNSCSIEKYSLKIKKLK